MTYAFYLQNAAALLSQKYKWTSNTEIFFGSFLVRASSRPANVETLVPASHTVNQLIKNSAKLVSILKSSDEEKVRTAVGCVQVFSDKSQTTLKAGWPSLYILYGKLRNFHNELSRFQILTRGLAFCLATGQISAKFDRKSCRTSVLVQKTNFSSKVFLWLLENVFGSIFWAHVLQTSLQSHEQLQKCHPFPFRVTCCQNVQSWRFTFYQKRWSNNISQLCFSDP